MKKLLLIVVVCIIVAALVFRYTTGKISQISQGQSMNMTQTVRIESSAFKNNEYIPDVYTCVGKGINPPLNFSNIPKNTKTLALLVTDPDAPGGVWTHWVLYNIPSSQTYIAQNSIPNGASEGISSGHTQGYEPPCPPSGTHRYIFSLYALSITVNLNKPSKESFEQAITGKILAKGELIGLYSKHR